MEPACEADDELRCVLAGERELETVCGGDEDRGDGCGGDERDAFEGGQHLEPDEGVHDSDEDPEEGWVRANDELDNVGLAGEFLACLVPAAGYADDKKGDKVIFCYRDTPGSGRFSLRM